MDDKFISRAIPEPVVVLGVRLRPFCIGHEIILRRFGCAFLDPESTPDHGDLSLGVLVCSQTYEAALEDVFDPEACARAIRSLERMNTGWLGRRVILWHEEFAKFRAYLADATECPDIIGRNEGRTLHIPFLEALRVSLIRMGNTESEAMNKPYGLALWDYLTCRAMDTGKVEFMPYDYDEASKAADEFEALVKERGLHGTL